LYFEIQKPKKVEINFDGDGGANHTLYLQQIKNSETTKTKAEREKNKNDKTGTNIGQNIYQPRPEKEMINDPKNGAEKVP